MIIKKLIVLFDTFKRFPAASILAMLNVYFVAWAVRVDMADSIAPLSFLYASELSIIFSAAVGLLGERFIPDRHCKGLLQVGVGIVFVSLVAAFYRYGRFEEHFYYSYFLTLFAFLAIVALMLSWFQRAENVFSVMSIAGLIALTASTAVGGGLTLVAVAIEMLFDVSIPSHIYGTIWGAAFSAIGTQFFLAYATRKEQFELPKACRVLLIYVTFPIFILLLCVLLAYFGKCVFAWELPNGQINWLVTTLCIIWMITHFMLGGVEARAIRLFRRFGAICILPLVALQICALWIRIGEYGLTPSRYASVLFVVLMLLLSAILLCQPRRSERLAYLLFAIVALFAAHSHWNIVDVGVRAQVARLQAFVERREAGEAFSQKDKTEIMGAWEFLQHWTLNNGSYRGSDRWISQSIELQEEFKKEWGFQFQSSWERDEIEQRDEKPGRTLCFTLSSNHKFDIKGFTTIRQCWLIYDAGKVYVKVDGGTVNENGIDITHALAHALIEMGNNVQNVIFDIGENRRVIINDGYVAVSDGDSGALNFVAAWGTCYLVER